MTSGYGVKERDPDKRNIRDTEVRRLAFDEGLGISVIAERVGLTDSRVGQILGVTDARKAILLWLEGKDPCTIRDISSALRMDINKAQYIVDNLKKRGYVTADIGMAGGDHKSFVNIRLRKGIRQPVPKFRVVSPEYREPAPKPVPEPEAVTAETPAVSVSVPLIDAEPVVTPPEVAPTEPEPEPDIAVADIPRYPLLWKLMERDSRIQEAAKLLESVGLDDLALAALQRTDEFTPVEREYMEFARKHHGQAIDSPDVRKLV